MKKNTKWEVLNKFKIQNSKFKIKELLTALLENRGLKTKKEQKAFLNPDITTVTPQSIGIDAKNLTEALKRVISAIEKKEQIIIFGDYDVDGIAGTAILWETLHALGANVNPYIPGRIDEGYGLSIKAIENVILNVSEGSHSKNRDSSPLAQNDKVALIITVDNGIVANEAVDYATSLGIDVIITDHHTIGSKIPKAHAIVHSVALCGTGVAWVFSREISKNVIPAQAGIHSHRHPELDSGSDSGQDRMTKIPSDHLALVALATVADLVPLTNGNRTLLTEGLKILHTTKRPGIIAMCQEAGINQKDIGVYEIGHMLAPRLNAMGRIASAMDSLRLLCTKDRIRAKALAEKLASTNKERQLITQSIAEHAINRISSNEEGRKNLIFLAHESYEEGVIGLVAGKLVEEFYRPTIVLSLGAKKSKASARSIKGFNIIEFIRTAQHLLINAGGHPMAAGFSIETNKVGELERFFAKNIQLADDILERSLRIDFELPLSLVSQQLYDSLQTLQPFGMGNPEPTFLSNAKILSIKQVGKEKNHLSLQVFPVIPAQAGIHSNRHPEFISGSQEPGSRIKSGMTFQGIAFGMGEMIGQLKLGHEVEIVYTIDENEWNERKSLQIKIKDIKIT